MSASTKANSVVIPTSAKFILTVLLSVKFVAPVVLIPLPISTPPGTIVDPRDTIVAIPLIYSGCSTLSPNCSPVVSSPVTVVNPRSLVPSRTVHPLVLIPSVPVEFADKVA